MAIAAAAAVPAAADAHVAHMVGSDATSLSTSSGGVEHVANVGGSTGGHVAIQGDRLYMGMYGAGLRIFDIGGELATAPKELGRWTPANSIIGPRAVADAPPDAAVFDGRHIAVLNGTNRTARQLPFDARTDNTYFLDTTEPDDIKLLWTFEGVHDGESHNGDIVDERRWWLPSGGRNWTASTTNLEGPGKNGLRIYDLNPLLEAIPRKPEVLFRGDPVVLWDNSPHRQGRPVGPAWDHTHDITVYPDLEVAGRKRDIALLVEGGNYTNNAGDTGSLFVIDITNPRLPEVLQRWIHPKAQGHHPIRYFHEAQFLDGDPRVVLVTDEDLHNGCDAGGVTALRLSEDLTTTEELSEWFIGRGYKPQGVSPFGPVCSVHVFSTHGNLAFFGSYNAGVQVVDYSNPAAPQFVGHNQQPGADSWGAQYAGNGLIYAGDFGARGLDVFEYQGLRPDLVAEEPTIAMGRGDRPSRLTIGVRNDGQVKAPPVVVEVYNGSQLLDTRTIDALASNGRTTFEVVWETKHVRGDQPVTVTVDRADRVDEVDDETNNTATATFAFKGRNS